MNLETLLGAVCIRASAVAQEYERVAKSIHPEPTASISKLTRLGETERTVYGDELKPTSTIFSGDQAFFLPSILV